MEPLVGSGEVGGEIYAALCDTLHTPRRHGMVPAKPVEDPAHLDERRAQLRIAPVSSNVFVDPLFLNGQSLGPSVTPAAARTVRTRPRPLAPDRPRHRSRPRHRTGTMLARHSLRRGA